jgi:hypothetical protein
MPDDPKKVPEPVTEPEPSSESIDQLWRDLIRVHQAVKKMLLEFEEFDGKTFLQPIKEQRDALEHVVRARAAEIGLTTQSPSYVRENLSKALGHEYRALFDIADHYSITIRERIIALLKPYSAHAIAIVVPEYYREVRPRLAEIDNRISGVRRGKDVAAPGEDLAEVDQYTQVIAELRDHYSRLNERIPALERYVGSVSVGEQIQKLVAPYSAQALSVVAPEYYRDICPRIAEVQTSTVEPCSSGGASGEDQDNARVCGFIKALTQLQEDYAWLGHRVPALEEYTRKEKAKARRESRNSFLIKVGAGLVVAGLLYLLACLYRSGSSPVDQAAAPSQTQDSVQGPR